ncbi:MAG: FtsX-like permease family protein [Microscillaceae bacterium]|nr:FtsX-like permease family protein [Microscillaceae bacterium]
MLKNYLKIAFRNLLKNKVYSLINIIGLAAGMTVAMLIGLWIYDELTYDTYHKHYPYLAQVMQHQTFNHRKGTANSIPRPLEKALRTSYGSDFKYLSMASWTGDHILSFGERKITKSGNYMQVDFPEMLTLKMLRGTRQGLKDVKSVLLSESTARALFGSRNPMGEIIKIDNKSSVKVTGVYEDLPYNSTLKDLEFIAPWDLYLSDQEWVRNSIDQWGNNSFQLFAQIHPQGNMQAISKKIKDIKAKSDKDEARFKPEVFLQPMSKWHLYSDFKEGINIGGRIQYVWLFGIIAVFVLMLACINFMNLSTARSEKRAKEVGIRKVIGSVKAQLIGQFLSESLLTVLLAFIISLLLTELALPFFNELSDKKMGILWTNPSFWMVCVVFTLFTGLISGSYPAFYLSSFQPVRVLKGAFKAGRYAAIPRKILVVLQFTVSVTLIIGTIIVYKQIQFIKNRPIGYDNKGIISVYMSTPDYYGKHNLIQAELKKTGAVVEMSQSFGPLTGIWSNWGGFDWTGKDTDKDAEFAVTQVTHDYGKTISWQVLQGRDFSRDLATDSSAVVINEAAVKFMGIQNPIGFEIKNDNGNNTYHIIGVVKDMIMQNPYEPVKHTLYFLNYDNVNFIHLKLNAEKSSRESIASIEQVFHKLFPAVPFEYKFVDQEFAEKFQSEERIGKLAGFFAGLAILISCLGLFGIASFMAEKRSKEIGIRKVLGATIFHIWRLLSKDFVWLVFISCAISIPLAAYFLDGWLQKYTYHTNMSWWIFAVAGLGAMGITLLTVSYQAIKAAMVNPVEVLKNE